MKTKTLQILVPAVKWLGVVTAGAATFSGILPPEWLFYGLLISNAASAVKDTLLKIGDKLDDGKINKSFKG